MFERVIQFMGENNLNKIKSKTVLIVGLGGVGGYALETLVRTGIEKLILIDFDKIDSSNLNRQLITNQTNQGLYKVDVAKERSLSINPACKIEIHKVFLDKNTIGLLDDYQIDYIVDACDSVEAKKLLIDYSLEHNIKLISSMGTANKIDPTKLAVLDIRKTAYDPLAKILRKYVMDKKTNQKIMVVSSTEEPIRKDKLSSLVFVPATSGILCANYVINDIIKKEEH